MVDRLQRVPKWGGLLVAVLLGALVYFGGIDGLLGVVAVVGVVLTALATIAAAVLQVWNPFEPRPKPHLTLRPLDGEETTSLALGGEWRAVDVEAIVKNARETALAATPSSSVGLMTGKYAEPTEADHEKYQADVEVYAEDVRAWAQAADEWLRDHALVLDAEVIQRNPSSVDADDAEVVITFPKGTVEFEEEDEPPEAPGRPGFPVRLSSAGRMLMGESPLSQVDRWRTRGLFSAGNEHVIAQLADLQQEASRGYPQFAQDRDGTLTLSYNAQTIRHRRDKPSGDPLAVSLPPGEHEVQWEVFAPNLPHSAKGTWTVTCPADPTREPINNTYDLEAALRGEPVRDFDLSELFGNQDDEAEASDRSDSSTDSR